ncbi:MAG: reactive intermediate/imine deaminase [Candidatus Moranbacteria bacterium]|nr:reactive intermediate/imine deaminase [Candidatus Moranbacteria bacterium]
MPKKIIQTSKAPKAIGPYSQAVLANGFVFLSGQIGLKPDGNLTTGGVKEQTQQIMKNLSAILSQVGLNFNNLVKTTIFLTDLANFDSVNQIYGQYFPKQPPARSTVEVKALPKGALIEIQAIALDFNQPTG